MNDRCRLPVFFYCTEARREPVRDWLQELDSQDRKAIGTDLLRVQEQWPIGVPVCRSLGKGVWEVRKNLSSNRTAWFVFFVDEDRIGVVHGKPARRPRPTSSLRGSVERDETMTVKKKEHWGSTLDDFLKK
jgi:phage-related protein